jgi:hypothetical protein
VIEVLGNWGCAVSTDIIAFCGVFLYFKGLNVFLLLDTLVINQRKWVSWFKNNFLRAERTVLIDAPGYNIVREGSLVDIFFVCDATELSSGRYHNAQSTLR